MIPLLVQHFPNEESTNILPVPSTLASSMPISRNRSSSLVCGSLKSVEAFLDFAKIEASAILSAHKSSVAAIADALLEQGTLNGEQIDEIISATSARDALEAERARRLEWRGVMERAAMFKATHGISGEDKTQ